jgi:metallophosphoesterase (TIGR00282 family)
MKILFIGDIVGKPGRRAVAGLVPLLRADHAIDMVIANGENSAHGSGLTASTTQALLESGVDVITSGDHIWDNKEIYEVIDREPRLVRPLNMAPLAPGHGSHIWCKDGLPPVAVVNVIGRVFMPPNDCPFRALHPLLDALRAQTPIIIVDIHAEATSEKIAMGWHLDGSVSAVLGTHTHVQTGDEQILPGGTAYISDVGMCGPHDSVLGRDKEAVLRRFLTGLPQRFEVANGSIILCGVLLDIDDQTGRARFIRRLRVPFPPENPAPSS